MISIPIAFFGVFSRPSLALLYEFEWQFTILLKENAALFVGNVRGELVCIPSLFMGLT